MSIYITYAHADEIWAQNLIERLRSEGYEISNLPLFRETADILLVVTTPAGVISEGVMQDIEAFSEKTTFPVIPPDAPPDINWMPHHLTLLKYVDFSQAGAYERLKTLLGAPPRQLMIPDHEEPPPFLARIPLGLVMVIILAGTLTGVLYLPEDSAIPAVAGWGLAGIVVLSLLLLPVSVIQRVRHSARQKSHVPDAFVEIIESHRSWEVGRRFLIRRRITTIGNDSQAHIRQGITAEQCRIYYDEHDNLFYLETRQATTPTLLHDRILQSEKPLPIWNGDLIMLTDQVILQFRFGKVK
jgi:hypothetical protein